MNVIALYNLKGGVGKTAAAVNLSYLAASHGYRTLIWDLDAQAAASFYFRVKPRIAGGAARLLDKKAALTKAIRATDYDSLDLVPADFSYRDLDLELGDRKKSSLRLRKLLKTVRQEYDLVFLDCAPSLSKVSENVFNMADWLVVPLIPTHLSLRAFEQLVKFRNRNGIHDGVLVAVFFDGRPAQATAPRTRAPIRLRSRRIAAQLRAVRQSDRTYGRASGASECLRRSIARWARLPCIMGRVVRAYRHSSPRSQ